jgi:hypothetical protein
MRQGPWIPILLGVCLCASCGRQSIGTKPPASKSVDAFTNMTEQEMDAMVQTIVHPSPKPWRERSIALALKAVGSAGTNDVRTIHDILLTDSYLAEFRKDAKEEWQAEASCLQWQQYTAVEAGQRPDVFGVMLLSYYFGSPEAVKTLSPADQIRKAALKLIQQGERHASDVGASDAQSGIAKCEYVVKEVSMLGDTAEVEAAVLKPDGGVGYKIQLKRVTTAGKEVWLPVKKDEAWNRGRR